VARNHLRARTDLELQEKYRAKHPKKICPNCNVLTPITEFGTKRSTPSGLNNICLACNCNVLKDHKAKLVSRSSEELMYDLPIGPLSCASCYVPKSVVDFYPCKEVRSGLTLYCNECWLLRSYEAREKHSAMECEECGYNNPLALDFAHYDRDTKAYSKKHGRRLQPSQLSEHRLADELPLMRLLCKVCHKYETMDEWEENRSLTYGALWAQNRIAPLRQRVNDEKINRGHCIDCELEVTDENCPIFDFDHRPGEIKIERIAALVGQRREAEVISNEMNKCDLRCKNCHAIVTVKRSRAN
jgi:hypothetical protein